MKLLKPMTWLGTATILVVGVVCMGVRLSDTPLPTKAIADSQAAMTPSPMPETQTASPPNQENTKPVAALISSGKAREWEAERKEFLQGKGFAAAIQRALSDPSAARLFYALKAVDVCTSLNAFSGRSSPEAQKSPDLVKVAEACSDVLVLNGNQVEFFAKYRAAKLDPSERAVLDAADGKGTAKEASIGQRFSTVSATDDALLMADVGASWTRSPTATFAGTPLMDETRAAFQEAWELAACEETSSCESSVAAFRLCMRQQQCTGSLRNRLEAVLPKHDYDALMAATTAVASALKSKDFSAFN